MQEVELKVILTVSTIFAIVAVFHGLIAAVHMAVTCVFTEINQLITFITGADKHSNNMQC